MHPSESPRRRATDRIDPVIELFVSEQIAEVRHLLRGEFTAAVVSVTNQIAEQGRTMTRIEKRVGELRAHDETSHAVADALDKQRTALRTYAFGLAGLIVAAAGVIVAILQ